MATDYLQMAIDSDRERFIEECPFPFLFGVVALRRPKRPDPTVSVRTEETFVSPLPKPPAEQSPPTPLALAVRKAHKLFPSMITIGRTANHDLVVPDLSVSKFHAFFRVIHADSEDGMELCDAGSRNGTWLGGERLERKGPALRVRLGDRIRVGHVELVLLDAAGLWDKLHERR